MRKLAIFFLIIVIIVVVLTYMIIDNQKKEERLKQNNQIYESYLNKEVNGLDLATVINKAIDNNTKNSVNMDLKGYYIEDQNSIKIDIKFIDNDKTYKMEEISKNQISNFTSYYGQIKFICNKIDYHKENGKVKYMLFEQITEF